ncbi:MAG TPA: Fe(3+)-hydroxamate ABC transporter permease FhuB [Steroidobacteraceae bacterium]|nr:Fe(3+)-hydroxamate ABC transporter permease FhuB [Steroidobacteraceae bacterium]
MNVAARDRSPLPLTLALALLAAVAITALLEPPLSHLYGPEPPLAGYDVARMVLLYATLPRLAIAALCGAALAASGAILQQVLSNPLASPTTLGVDAGARLALALATVLAPGLLHWGADLVALAGSAIATVLVFLIVGRRNFSALSLILAGLVISLFCGAISSLLALVAARQLTSLFIWGSGSLSQQSWSPFLALARRLAVLAVPLLLLIRPLALLDAGEESARSLGLAATRVRIAAVAIAVALSAFVVATVGVIGFMGLVAPILARLAGARRFGAQLVWSMLIGAALLLLTDATVQLLGSATADLLPTGAVTAVLGSPLLLLLLPRMRHLSRPPAHEPPPRNLVPRRGLASVVALGLVALVGLSLLIGRGAMGNWTLSGESWQQIMTWRLPRVVASAAAGSLLAVAGAILQRLTQNDLASPEVLGVGAGSILAVGLGIFGLGHFWALGQGLTAMLGGLAVLLIIVPFGGRSGFAPERMLLAGIALSALMDSVVGVLCAGGDPRALQLLAWMAGFATGVTLGDALLAAAAALGVVLAGLLMARWLAILPLGAPVATGLGVHLTRARLVLLVIAAAATAAATPILGPFTFIGLLAPHLAAALGVRRPAAVLIAAAAAGAGIMAGADWLARTVAFPLQLPTGLLASLVGAPALMILLNRRLS